MEPLNLVIRPQEEPLNLSTKCSARSQITGKLEPLSVSDKNESKVMKKVFSPDYFQIRKFPLEAEEIEKKTNRRIFVKK